MSLGSKTLTPSGVLVAVGGQPVDSVQFLEDVVDSVTTLETAATTADSDITALEVKSKYTLALVNRKHMKVDTALVGVAALVAEDQTATDERAEAIRTALLAHMASVGTYLVDGSHLAADTALAATLAAVPAATNLATCIVLVNALLVAANSHGDSSGVHFHDDATLGALTITTDPPTTLAQCRTDLNDILAALQTHFALGSV